MNFAAAVVGAGIASAALIFYIESTQAVVADIGTEESKVDRIRTGSIGRPKPSDQRSSAIRLIDLRSGANCKMARPDALPNYYTPAPLGPDCVSSPELRQVSQWRSGDDGALEMADAEGETVLRFMPGDGVLFESIYPSDTMMTIVPARG
jgi:hypothetical protein